MIYLVRGDIMSLTLKYIPYTSKTQKQMQKYALHIQQDTIEVVHYEVSKRKIYQLLIQNQ